MEDVLTALELRKDRERQQYQARYARIGARQAKQKKPRSSDIALPRIGDGIPPRHEARVTNRFVRKVVKLPGILAEMFGP